MKLKSLLHSALACVLLLQSVVAFASVGSVEPVSTQPAPAMEHGAMAGCHDAAPEAPAYGGDCCESMDQSCCQLGCASSAQAVPMADIGRWNENHLAYAVTGGALNPRNTPTGLFRPPRTT